MKNSEFILAVKLKEKIEEKNALLQCLITSYTGALSFVEQHDYDAFMQNLDRQHAILAEIDECRGQISTISGKLEEEKNKIIALGAARDKNSDISEILKSISKSDYISKTLLKNSKALNEKLTFKIKEIAKELEEGYTASKNHKKLNSAYGKNTVPKAGLIMDYKNN